MSTLKLISDNDRLRQNCKEVLESALACEPDEVLIVCFKRGGYHIKSSGTLSNLQQVGCLEALKLDLLSDTVPK